MNFRCFGVLHNCCNELELMCLALVRLELTLSLHVLQLSNVQESFSVRIRKLL